MYSLQMEVLTPLLELQLTCKVAQTLLLYSLNGERYKY
jgi:hypothetical protein